MAEAGLRDFRYLEGKSTQCYVADGDDGRSGFVVVTFSGSDMRQREGNGAFDVLADWLVNLSFEVVPSVYGGRVHRSFKEALDEIWDPPDREAGDRSKNYLDEVCECGRGKA